MLQDKFGREVTVDNSGGWVVYSIPGCVVTLPTRDDAKALEIIETYASPVPVEPPFDYDASVSKVKIRIQEIRSRLIDPGTEAIYQEYLTQANAYKDAGYSGGVPALIALKAFYEPAKTAQQHANAIIGWDGLRIQSIANLEDARMQIESIYSMGAQDAKATEEQCMSLMDTIETRMWP